MLAGISEVTADMRDAEDTESQPLSAPPQQSMDAEPSFGSMQHLDAHDSDEGELFGDLEEGFWR